MLKEVLLQQVRLYYPKDICPYEREKYMRTIEYERLTSLIDYFDSEANIRVSVKNEFENDEVLKDFEDFSRLDSNQDRCYTFYLNVFEDGELYLIALHLSILMPYYLIRKSWHPAEPFFTKSRVEELEREKKDRRKIDELIIDVETIVEKRLMYEKFPPSLMNQVIADSSFGDIYLGNFTMYNAFFNNINI